MEEEKQIQLVPPASKRLKLVSSTKNQRQTKLFECTDVEGNSKACNQKTKSIASRSLVLSDTDNKEEETRIDSSEERYYLLNFKSILNMVLTSSPERHVLADDANSIVDKFMDLNRMLTCITSFIEPRT